MRIIVIKEYGSIANNGNKKMIKNSGRMKLWKNIRINCN